MKKKLSEGRESKRQALLRKKKEEPAAFWTYVVLRFIVILILIRCILRGDIESAFVCVLVLVIYLLPQFVENRLNIDIPTTLEVVIFVFVFAAEILGELQSYFIKYSNWDTILHTSSGFLCAAVGFSLVDLLNRSDNVKVQLSPGYLAITAFCFSMTIGILWEFIEFSADRLFLLDMQKDTIVNQISSVSLDPTNSNISITVKGIKDVILVHGLRRTGPGPRRLPRHRALRHDGGPLRKFRWRCRLLRCGLFRVQKRKAPSHDGAYAQAEEKAPEYLTH